MHWACGSSYCIFIDQSARGGWCGLYHPNHLHFPRKLFLVPILGWFKWKPRQSLFLFSTPSCCVKRANDLILVTWRQSGMLATALPQLSCVLLASRFYRPSGIMWVMWSISDVYLPGYFLELKSSRGPLFFLICLDWVKIKIVRI